ncbi:putative sulfate exporter family transporter [Agarivorans sp. TSD2052]|uniref:YeiH family protein n=1 Tax=Agarivorans sp. TSD2052 TaxID=2937286 RepID=UPI00200F261B|nr:putative sulfate exporter family transporter [Agarivorans sp. TSD2052]UPW20621.1 putative sulfate exporter family transporter [Agarivorans sp. TSD2052]
MLKKLQAYSKADVVCVLVALLVLSPWVNGPAALVFGACLASIGLSPKAINVSNLTKRLLAISVVGLGFGISIGQAIEYTQHGFGLIVGSILFTLILGGLATKALDIDKKTGYLISTGTAICGGSAIAAVSPAINASSKQMSLALATVFILNACGLFIFPLLGHLLELNQLQFGYWAAIAIHDTSSVVGAAAAYGDEALTVATTVKLARALWIIPVALLSAVIFKEKDSKFSVPYFIFFYILAMLISNYVPQFSRVYEGLFTLSKELLGVCLFFIGYGLTAKNLQMAGLKPLLLGIGLWVSIACSSLWVIVNFY